MQKDVRHKLIKRLKIIEGQVRGLQRMAEQETYCVDILTQTAAVKRALSSFEDMVLENHLATHVVEQMKSGKHTKAITEVMKVYQLSKKQK